MTKTLRDIAIEITKENISKLNSPEKAILVLGISNSGKSSLITRWLDKHPATNNQRTPIIDYLWSRKSNQICHIWELPEAASLNHLQTILRPSRQFKPNIFLITLDLSRPNFLIPGIQQRFNNIEPFYSQVSYIVIVGSKYDTFQNLESELKKNVCKFLRGLSILKSAHLIFYSNEIPALIKRMNDLLNELIWNVHSKIAISKDHHTPLYILPNSDNWNDIGISVDSVDQLCSFYEKQIRHIIK